MAILAGIDEAGYGPHLGPLVVAAAAIELAGPEPPDPDLWHALRGHVRKRLSGSSTRVVICDSKISYGCAGDLAPLERGVLGFLAAAGLRPRSLAELIEMTHVAASPDGDPPAAAQSRSPQSAQAQSPDARRLDGDAPALPRPWHRPESLALPTAAAARDIDAAAAHIARGLAKIGARPGGLRINVASAARLNVLIAGGRNKADALFSLSAGLLADILHRWPRQAILITMDRHGGRRYYAPLLAGAFPMTTVETIEESPGLSRYRLVRGAAGAGGAAGAQLRVPATSDPGCGVSSPRTPHATGDGPIANEMPAPAAPPVDIAVRDRCESWSLATALASMVAKYVRELYMIQLNAYFRSLVPDLAPTAGYGRDAWRFLDDVAAARAAAGVPDAAILRTR